MDTRMKLQVIDESDTGKEDSFIWDFSDPNSGYMSWFLWFANDPPDVIRITCVEQELLDAMREFWNSHYVLQENGPYPQLYQEGDEVWKSAWDNHVLLNLKLENIK